MSGFHLLSNFWLDSKNEWCRETTGRASNINIRLAKHSHLSVREEPLHTNTCGTNPAGQTALGRLPVREELQHKCLRPILLMRPHSKCVYSTSSPLWIQSLSKHYKMPQVYPEVIEWSGSDLIDKPTSCQQERQLLTVRSFATDPFFSPMTDSMTHYTFLESLPTVADDVVCDPPLYGTGSGDQSRAYKSLPTHQLNPRS